MGPKAAVPDAWDDDWETLADNPAPAPVEPAPKLSREERKTQHAEANKRLWDAAETPERNLFVEAQTAQIPLAEAPKPTVKVLARKPQKSNATSATAGLGNLSIQPRPDDAGDSSEEEARKAAVESLAERQARAKTEREEKQRRYDEMRSKLFGDEGSGSSGRESPSAASPRGRRGRGRGRQRGDESPRAGASTSNEGRLFDPSYSPKPGSAFVQRGQRPAQDGLSAVEQEQIIRTPRGPDASGRGGFGFRGRGGRGRG